MRTAAIEPPFSLGLLVELARRLFSLSWVRDGGYARCGDRKCRVSICASGKKFIENRRELRDGVCFLKIQHDSGRTPYSIYVVPDFVFRCISS
jgi:hypothetical protein